MKRRKITWSVETDMQGSTVAGEFWVDEVFKDTPTETDLADYVRDEVFQHVKWGWEESTEESAS